MGLQKNTHCGVKSLGRNNLKNTRLFTFFLVIIAGFTTCVGSKRAYRINTAKLVQKLKITNFAFTEEGVQDFFVKQLDSLDFIYKANLQHLEQYLKKILPIVDITSSINDYKFTEVFKENIDEFTTSKDVWNNNNL